MRRRAAADPGTARAGLRRGPRRCSHRLVRPRCAGATTVSMTEQNPTFRYRAVVLEALEKHGIRPRPSTPPELVHEFISDLYRFELRRLRARLVAGKVARQDYFDLVVGLRRQYPLVSLKPRQFVDEGRPE